MAPSNSLKLVQNLFFINGGDTKKHSTNKVLDIQCFTGLCIVDPPALL